MVDKVFNLACLQVASVPDLDCLKLEVLDHDCLRAALALDLLSLKAERAPNHAFQKVAAPDLDYLKVEAAPDHYCLRVELVPDHECQMVVAPGRGYPKTWKMCLEALCTGPLRSGTVIEEV